MLGFSACDPISRPGAAAESTKRPTSHGSRRLPSVSRRYAKRQHRTTVFSVTADGGDALRLGPATDQRVAPGDAFPRYGAAKRRAASSVAEPAPPLEAAVVDAVALRERFSRRSLAAADALAAAGSAAIVLGVIAGYQLNPLFLLVMPAIVLIAKTQGLYDRDELVIHKSTLSEFPRLLNLGTLLALLLWISRKEWVNNGTPRTLYLLALWLLLVARLPRSRTSSCFAAQHSRLSGCSSSAQTPSSAGSRRSLRATRTSSWSAR